MVGNLEHCHVTRQSVALLFTDYEGFALINPTGSDTGTSLNMSNFPTNFVIR